MSNENPKKEIEFRIGDRVIDTEHPPFVIAELSGNHNQSLERAMKLVEIAAECGVDAIKLQTYTADTITLNKRTDEFVLNSPSTPWDKSVLYDLYQKAHTPWEWHAPLFKRAQELGLKVFSTPFDSTAVEFLCNLGVPCFKIASFENIDIPLIRLAASKGKPIIMSTGMAEIAELDEAVRAVRSSGAAGLALLKCTSAYPASPSSSNIITIAHLKNLFGCQVGLSDHTLGIGTAVASVAFGATIIEKHLTISRAEGGVDSAFSLEPNEMRQLVVETKNAWLSLGKISYGPTLDEAESIQFRRSLYVVKDIKKGEAFSETNLKSIRPGYGLKPKYLDIVLGKSAASDISVGTALTWDHILTKLR